MDQRNGQGSSASVPVSSVKVLSRSRVKVPIPRTGHGQTVKGLTAVTGDQVPDLLLHE